MDTLSQQTKADLVRLQHSGASELNQIRVEAEPSGRNSLARQLTPALGWKQFGDDGQDRYSVKVRKEQFPNALRRAIEALEPGEVGVEVNPSAPESVQRIVERAVQAESVLHPVRCQVFISYSHKDRKCLESLQTMLKPVVKNRPIIPWADTQIKAGTKWRDEIERALRSTKVAVLLVSKDFLASDFIQNNELPQLLKAANEQGLTILWVPVGTCMYEDTEIAQYQATHDPSRPLNNMTVPNREKALLAVCKKIKAAAEEA